MGSWTDPKDTLGLPCPKCGSTNLYPVPFVSTYDDAGHSGPPAERWFICPACKHQFKISREEYL